MKKIPMDPKPPKNVSIKDSVREEAEAEKQQEAKPEKDKVDQVEITMDKVSGQQTAATAVMNLLKKAKAFDEDSAVGYSVLKDIKLTTPVLAYTLANLMKEEVICRTADERYYYSKAGWKKIEKKVYVGYAILFVVPVVAIILFVLLQKYFKW